MPYNANAHEQEILEFWKQNNTFEKSIESRPENKPYVFYDGPPFATGLPHYGHILSSVIKDVVPRYMTMKGYRVRRRWGWDCHGLPIESMIEKELKISGKKQIEEMGVGVFNEACRSKVLMYTQEWKKMVERIGRWVEFDDSYKTMDPTYMESVWWALKNIWDKGRIYEGRKVLMYCPRCETPVSKAEVTMDNSYKDLHDQSVIAKFPITDKLFLEKFGNNLPTSFLAWTTTPWSIPTTMGLAVGEEFAYVIIRFGNEQVICAKERSDYVTKHLEAGTWSLVSELRGSDMIGVSYTHSFPEYLDHEEVVGNPNVFKTHGTDYVSTADGTGIVTINGAFGEIDYEASKKIGLPVIVNVGSKGEYMDSRMGDLVGRPVKPKGDPRAMDIVIANLLEERKALWRREEYTHSYPHCWRCESPLIYRAISAWFIDMQTVKQRLLELNEKINWYPDHLKHGRFENILETAPDWNISRNRYWATPLPFWRCKKQGTKDKEQNDCRNVVCVGSVKELKERAVNFEEVYKTDKVEEMDLHKQYADQIRLRCEQCGGEMERIPEVIDCWVESGSMPFAEWHYPFENKETFEARFPGHYIAEYIGQIRAWFYYLHAVGTHLFDNIAFQNVVTTGNVLNEKGEKMSKSKKNYPDPWLLIEQYGVDALRYYLMTSVVMQADDLFFSDRGVREAYNRVVNTLWNVFVFYETYKESQKSKVKSQKSNHILDRWILAKLQLLVREVTEGMDAYDTVRAGRPIQEFIDELSTWYLRRSRDRFKSDDETDKQAALATLGDVLLTLSKIMAPFMPFMGEKIYQGTKDKEQKTNESVHLEEWPQADEKMIDDKVINDMVVVRKVVEMGLALRAEAGIKVRQPLSKFSVFSFQFSNELKKIIADELNIKEVFGEDVRIDEKWRVKEEGEMKVALNIEISPELKKEGLVREIVRTINQMRKDKMLTPSDMVTVTYATGDPDLQAAFTDFASEIKKQVAAREIVAGDGGEAVKIDGKEVKLEIRK